MRDAAWLGRMAAMAVRRRSVVGRLAMLFMCEVELGTVSEGRGLVYKSQVYSGKDRGWSNENNENNQEMTKRPHFST